MNRFAPLVLGLGLALIAACGASCAGSAWTFREDPAPTPTETVTPTPTPTIGPSRTLLFGDGRDLDRVASAGTTMPTNCVALMASTGATLSLAAANGFSSGDLAFVLWMQDAFAMSGDGTPIVEAAAAGSWSLSTVSAAPGTSLVLTSSLAFSYTTGAGRRAQVCRVPQFANVTLSGTAVLAAEPWDGTTGGVLAFVVSGTLTIPSSAVPALDASAAGFRGGTEAITTNPACATAATPAPLDDTLGGGKGEGLDGRASTLDGRGNFATAGGGGGAREAGGAGGGNGGAGGPGGDQGCDDLIVTGGLGGASLDVSAFDRLTFGGGGGGGQRADTASGPGGAGGGLVFVYAETLTGGGAITADGAAGGVSSSGGGAGGGGAGGTIVLRTNASTFSGSIRAKGGAGGDGNGPIISESDGGGGGGGRVLISGAVAAGGAGIALQVAGAVDGDSGTNALPGAPGVLEIVEEVE